MGKYMRKSKLTTSNNEVITVGVRTRAKTLALQKLQSSRTTAVVAVAPPPEFHREMSYLQLRSRRLEKPLSCYKKQNPNPRLVNSSGSHIEAEEETGDGDDTCFGENNIDSKRSTSESTPCSFIRESNASSTPGSSTRPTNRQASNQTIQNSIQSIMPYAQEIEEFFARHALEQQRRFTEKYNFDVVNEKPLQGRYEWVKVQP